MSTHRLHERGTHTEHGNREVARGGEILRTVVGSLSKYLRLATKGNPTARLPLFAPPESVVVSTPLGEELRTLAPAVLSQTAVHRFLGYLQSQRERLLGRGRRSAVPNRPD